MSRTEVSGYRAYWIAWFALLLLTVGMVFVGAKPVTVGGMLAKAGIITLLYMHLVHERPRLVWTVLLGIFRRDPSVAHPSVERPAGG